MLSLGIWANYDFFVEFTDFFVEFMHLRHNICNDSFVVWSKSVIFSMRLLLVVIRGPRRFNVAIRGDDGTMRNKDLRLSSLVHQTFCPITPDH